jgi:hypothetical protein
LGYAAHYYTWTAWWHVGAPAEEEVTYEEVNSRFAEVDEAKCQAEKSMENFLTHSSGIEKYPLQKDFKVMVISIVSNTAGTEKNETTPMVRNRQNVVVTDAGGSIEGSSSRKLGS